MPFWSFTSNRILLVIVQTWQNTRPGDPCCHWQPCSQQINRTVNDLEEKISIQIGSYSFMLIQLASDCTLDIWLWQIVFQAYATEHRWIRFTEVCVADARTKAGLALCWLTTCVLVRPWRHCYLCLRQGFCFALEPHYTTGASSCVHGRVYTNSKGHCHSPWCQRERYCILWSQLLCLPF